VKGKRTKVLAIHDAAMLHPETCNSSIRYSLVAYCEGSRKVADLSICLTDCDRQITWRGWSDKAFDAQRKKIDSAIRILGEARANIDTLEKHYKRMGKK
jgi:hypothetical protein